MRKINRKGFSLVEVVIAMAVVSIVTLTAISIVYSATDRNKQANIKSDAIYFTADVIECFKATETAKDFYYALKFRENCSFLTPTDAPEDNATSCLFICRFGSQCVATISWDAEPILYGEDQSYTTHYTINISIQQDKADGTSIPLISRTFKKAERSYETETNT